MYFSAAYFLATGVQAARCKQIQQHQLNMIRLVGLSWGVSPLGRLLTISPPIIWFTGPWNNAAVVCLSWPLGICIAQKWLLGNHEQHDNDKELRASSLGTEVPVQWPWSVDSDVHTVMFESIYAPYVSAATSVFVLLSVLCYMRCCNCTDCVSVYTGLCMNNMYSRMMYDDEYCALVPYCQGISLMSVKLHCYWHFNVIQRTRLIHTMLYVCKRVMTAAAEQCMAQLWIPSVFRVCQCISISSKCLWTAYCKDWLQSHMATAVCAQQMHLWNKQHVLTNSLDSSIDCDHQVFDCKFYKT